MSLRSPPAAHRVGSVGRIPPGSAEPSAAMDAPETISTAQWRGFFAAWLGWAFDGLDGFLYTLVALPFVTELLGKGVPKSEAAAKAALIQAVFLMGWAIGGAFFGRLGDRIGRSKTLTLTILTYAVFTGMAFFAQTWWQLLIFRFVAALGIGGEWAAGSALVAETFHSRHRGWASATLQSGYMVGMILAALTVGQIGDHPRWVFLVGVIPAFVTIWIRKAVPESEEWTKTANREKPPPITAIFASGIRSTTLITLGLTSIALTTVWVFLYFVTQALRGLPEAKAMTPNELKSMIMGVTLAYNVVNIGANYVATYCARAIGYRWTFGGYFFASMLTFLVGFSHQHTLEATRIWILVAAFFALGLFGIFPLYIPPLFPTLLRTTASGFSYNFGRMIAAVGTFGLGAIAARTGSPERAIYYAGFLYIPGLLLALFLPEPYPRSLGKALAPASG